MSSDNAIISLQSFFLGRMEKFENCKHESTFASPENNPDFTHEYCYCHKVNKIHLTPKLATAFVTNPTLRELKLDTTFENNIIVKLFGLEVVIDAKTT